MVVNRGLQAAEYTRTSQLDSITIPQAPRLGSQVVEVQGLCKSYGDRLLMKDLSFSVPPGSVVGPCPPQPLSAVGAWHWLLRCNVCSAAFWPPCSTSQQAYIMQTAYR